MTERRLRAIDPPALGAPRGYANGILAPGGGRLLFVAGQVGWDAGQNLVSHDFVGQFAQALDNILLVVEAAGGAATDVARMTVYVVDKAEYAAARRELAAQWRARFGRHYPAMSLVEVRGLLELGARVEIEATAVIP